MVVASTEKDAMEVDWLLSRKNIKGCARPDIGMQRERKLWAMDDFMNSKGFPLSQVTQQTLKR